MPPDRAEAPPAISAPKKHSNRSTGGLPENTPKNVNEISGAKTPFRAPSVNILGSGPRTPWEGYALDRETVKSILDCELGVR